MNIAHVPLPVTTAFVVVKIFTSSADSQYFLTMGRLIASHKGFLVVVSTRYPPPPQRPRRDTPRRLWKIISPSEDHSSQYPGRSLRLYI